MVLAMRRLVAKLALSAFGVALAIGCAASGSTPTDVPPADAGADVDAAPPDAQLVQGDDAAAIFSGCATAKAPIERDPIYMLMVLDGSGSMHDDFKWAAIIPALEGFIDNLNARKDVSFGLGLTIFSDSNDPTAGAGPYTKIDVPIAFVDDTQVAALKARLDAAQPQGQTPTYAVLSGQYPLLEAYTPAPPLLTQRGHKVLVLMTDGVPYPDTATQQPKCIDAAKAEFAKAAPAGPVTTLAVGIGQTLPLDPQVYDPLFMAQLALAGGAPNQPCDPNETLFESNMCHFQITPISSSQSPIELEQEMLIAFDRVRARVTSCELTLDKSGTVDPSLVNVVFTDDTGTQQVVLEDPANGWTYDDPTSPTKVILHGKSCDALKANASGDVEVVLGCKTIVK